MSKKALAIVLLSIVLFLVSATLAVCLPKNSHTGGSANISSSISNSTKFDNLNKELNKYIAKVQELEADKKELQENYNEIDTKYNKMLADYNSTTDALVTTRKELIQAKLDIEAKDDEISEYKGKMTELTSQLKQLQDDYDELQSKYTNALLDADKMNKLLSGEYVSIKMPDCVTSLPRYSFYTFKIDFFDLNNINHIDQDSFLYVNTLYSAVSSLSCSNSLRSNVKKADFSNVGTFTYSSASDLYVEQILKFGNVLFSFPTSNFNINVTKYLEIGNILNDTYSVKIKIGSAYNHFDSSVINFTGDKLMPYSTLSLSSGYDVSNLTIYVKDSLLTEYTSNQEYANSGITIKAVSEMPLGLDVIE